MPSLLPLSALAALLALACAAATTPARTSAAVFEVLVGASDPKLGIEVQVFAPDRLFIRPGDTVVFKQTTYEIHSVTFLAGQPIPQLVIPIPGEPGALQINPIAGFPTQPSGGLFDPTKYINSGVNAGPNSWNITFPSAGVFPYLCIVHGQSMGGVIRVVNKRKMAKIPKAAAVSAKAAATVAQYIADARAQYPGIVAKVPAPTRNADNTLTHYVYLGYRAKANVMIDLNWFFPANITAKRGDTVKFLASPGNMDVPHVVGFYNGATVPQLVLVKPRTGAPPLLQVNPELVAPINPGVAVKRTQVFTSGWINPGQNATFKLGPQMTPGVLPYVCPIHLPGMVGAIRVTA